MKIGFPVCAIADARVAPDSNQVFVIAVGGGGASKTGVKNGFVILRVTSGLFLLFSFSFIGDVPFSFHMFLWEKQQPTPEGAEEVYRNEDAQDELLCAAGCSGPISGADGCVFFAYGCTNSVDVLRVAPGGGAAVAVRVVAHFAAFPPRDPGTSSDAAADAFSPSEVTAVHLSAAPRDEGAEGCVLSCAAGSGAGAVVLWAVDVAAGRATRVGALPPGDAAAPDENKVKCIARAGEAVAAVTLGDGRCRVWDAHTRRLQHVWDAPAFGLAADTRPLMRFCALTSGDGTRLTVAAASRLVKDRRAGCWIASRDVNLDGGDTDSDNSGDDKNSNSSNKCNNNSKCVQMTLLPGATAMASCSVCDVGEGARVAAVGTCEGGVLAFEARDGACRARRTLAAPACHGLVTTATRAVALAGGPLLVLSAGTDGTCRVHRPAPGSRSRAPLLLILSVLVGVAAVVSALVFLFSSHHGNHSL